MPASGILNTLASNERAKEPDKNITKIYIGNLHWALSNAFLKSQNEGKPIYFQDINGIPIFVDARQGQDGYWVSRNGEEFKPKEEEEDYRVTDEKGYVWHMSKTKAKQRGLIK